MWYWAFWRKELVKKCFYQLLQIAAQSAGTGNKAVAAEFPLKVPQGAVMEGRFDGDIFEPRQQGGSGDSADGICGLNRSDRLDQQDCGNYGEAVLCKQATAFWKILCRENAVRVLRLFL